jgi:hypothetical protein
LVLEAIAFVVSGGFLLLIFGLASMAFRGGERAGYPEIVRATALAGEGPTLVRRRTAISAVNQFLVWGLALTLVAATAALLVLTFVWDGWAWP